jgi:hypothetical protein
MTTIYGAWTVNPAQITVTVLSGSSIYGSSPANPGLSATGLQNNQDVSVLAGLSNSFGITNQTNAGRTTLAVAGTLANANYGVTGTINGAWIVNPAPITVTALSGTSEQGASPANPGLAASGLQNAQSVAVLTGLSNSFGINHTSSTANSPYTLDVVGILSNRNYSVTARNSGLWVITPPPAIPLTLLSAQYQPPNNASIVFVNAQNAPGAPWSPSRGRHPTPRPSAGTNDGLVTGSLGTVLDGLVYLPISQYDAAQYSGDKLPDYADRAGLATILTMIDRAIAHDKAPTIDHLFDPAKGADWHGVGWQNPFADKVTFAAGAQASGPNAANALPLDGTTDLGALLGHGPVILAGAGETSWLLATVRTEAGILANDPVSGLHVLLAYNPESKAVGPINRMLDPGTTKWIALSDAAGAGLAFVDAAKVAALQAFAAEKYLAVTLAK